MKKMIRLTESDLHKIIKESVNKILNEQNDEYSIFHDTFMGYANEMIQELQNDYLSSLGLKISLDNNYAFRNKRWFAAYERTKNMIDNGVILIALNIPYLYKCMKKRRIDKDEFNIEAQARITIGHEIGHGIIDYLLNVYDGESDLVDELVHDYYNCELDKEELVEEFGKYLFPDATGVWSSELIDVIEDIIMQPSDQHESQTTS